jgi:hypothetical protein
VSSAWDDLLPDILDVGLLLVRGCKPTQRPLWDIVSARVKKPKDLRAEGAWTPRR